MGKAVNLLRRVYLAFIVVHVEEDTSLTTTQQLIRVGHSPDPDDAFMFHALANGHVETGEYRFEHELVDIEMLNQRAFSGELELTAISVHAYAHLADKYILCFPQPIFIIFFLTKTPPAEIKLLNIFCVSIKGSEVK